MGVTQAAGLSLRWIRDQLRRDGRAGYDTLTAEASRVPPGADGVIWAPYLMGERTPHTRSRRARRADRPGRQPHARPCRRAPCWKASRSACATASRSSPSWTCRSTRIRVGGGGARSALWREIQAGHLRPCGRDRHGGRRRRLWRGGACRRRRALLVERGRSLRRCRAHRRGRPTRRDRRCRMSPMNRRYRAVSAAYTWPCGDLWLIPFRPSSRTQVLVWPVDRQQPRPRSVRRRRPRPAPRWTPPRCSARSAHGA